MMTIEAIEALSKGAELAGRDKERHRCAAIVQVAREGTIDGDPRSVIHRIKSGDPAPQSE